MADAGHRRQIVGNEDIRSAGLTLNRLKQTEKLGARRVTAEVLSADASGYVSLSVCECEIISNVHNLPLKLLMLRKKETIRKLRSSIGKGNGERLKWSEEGARSLVVSKFLK